MKTQYHIKGILELEHIELSIYNIDKTTLSIDNNNFYNIKNKKGSRYEFTIEYQAKNDVEAKKLTEILVTQYINTISFSLNIPIKNWQITEILNKEHQTNIVCSDERSFGLVGCRKINVSNKQIEQMNHNLKRIQREDDLCLTFYRQSFSDNHVENFWKIYNILLIIIGERKQIDQEYKKYLSNKEIIPDVWHNKKDGNEYTVLVAIRDSFSHQTEFTNRTMKIQDELKDNINTFRDFARKTICQKYKLTI